MKKKDLNDNLFIAGAIIFALSMVAFPSVTEAGSKEAIIIWANSIVPVLLPFFIFADFIKRTGVVNRAPQKIYPFIMAFLSGYPMGAKVVGDLVSCRRMSCSEGRFVLSYSLVTGPAFIFGTINSFLGNTKAAIIVAIAHYSGAIINGLLYRKTSEETKFTRNDFEKREFDLESQSRLESFTASIASGFKAMAMILAYLIIFMIGIELISKVGLFSLFSSESASAFAKGLLEMTVGANYVCLANAAMQLKTAMVSFIISFGGLSVVGQSSSMLGGSGINGLDVIKIKFSHGLISGIISVILGIIML